MRATHVRGAPGRWLSRCHPERANVVPARTAARVRAAGAGSSLPRTPKEIQQYTRKALRSELQREEFDIMRACLLVALEEEAALSVHQSIIFENLRAQGEDVSEAVASINSRISSAVRSQFNTARIDALADVVLHAFVQSLDLPLPDDLPKRASQQPTSATPAVARPPRRPTPPNLPPVHSSSAVTPIDSSQAHTDDQSEHEAQSSDSDPNTDADSSPRVPREPSEVQTDASASNTTPPSFSVASRPDISDSLPGLEPLQRPQRVRHLAEHPALPPLLQLHTALFLHVASDVLFNLHGYRQPSKHGSKRGNMDSFLMNSVLETGVGAPIVLAIIFRAVCRRAGVSVNLSVLDGGSDCVVWPEGSTGESGIRVSGHTLVIDIFSRGAVMLEAEVKEFFDVESLTPSSDRDLLFALLSGLQDCNWRLALDHNDVWSRKSVAQCLQAALQPITAVKEPYHLSRAVAAAERCLLVKPRHIELHLYAASLCFLDQNLHRCLQHLQLVYGSIDLSSNSSSDECSDPYEGDSEGDSESMNAMHGEDVRSNSKNSDGRPSVFAVRRNVSIEDVCLLQRPRWQGGRSGSEHAHMHGMHERLAAMGVDMGASAHSFGRAGGMPEVRVVKRGGGGGVASSKSGDSAADSAVEYGGEEVVARLREKEVVLRRPWRCGSGSVATGGTGGEGCDDAGGVDSGAEEEDVGVWEWSEGAEGELVFITDSGEKVAITLTDQAPLPLDRSIMGEVSESMGVLWHKTVLMQQMGDSGTQN